MLFLDLALAHVARAPPPAAVALFLLLLLILLLILNLALTLGLTQLIFELALAFGWRSASALQRYDQTSNSKGFSPEDLTLHYPCTLDP